MQRTTHKIKEKPSAIFCADLHLREDTPVCFTGDFQQEQWDSLDFISNLQKEYTCPVFCSGDVFHIWKTSPWLISKTIQHIPDQFYTVAGQHDLPQHSMILINKAGLFTLIEAKKATLLNECNWGQDPDKGSYIFPSTQTRLLVWHHLAYITKPFPGAEGGMAEGLLRKYPQFPVILCGDNHQSFSIKFEDRLLVNPGSLTRQSAKQIDFKPSIYLYYEKSNSVERVFLPIQQGVISREHIEEIEQRDARIDAFISTLDKDWKVGFDFTENLKQFQQTNLVKQSVMEIIFRAIEI